MAQPAPGIRGMTSTSHFNATADLLDRNLAGDRGERVAIVVETGTYTYAGLADRVRRASNAFRTVGLGRSDRLLLCLFDTIDFPTCFLGAIQAGVIPVPLSTLATADDYAWIL